MSEIPSETLQRLGVKYLQREQAGYAKYGCTVDRTDLTPSEWCEHALQEQMDSTLYLSRMQQKVIVLEEQHAGMKTLLQHLIRELPNPNTSQFIRDNLQALNITLP